ncbi:MAG: ABC transporter permease [Chloroflexi bacterium]|nr:ABC transporter permease [Chloroflexota bacterium]MCL5951196.1 ABC transporter permease [Chloroflexota bacterium]
MNIVESMRVAFLALGSNKLRAGLTMLGIIIGVAAVIALLAVGNGASAEITRQVQGIGSNLIVVVPGQIRQGGVSGMGTAVTLTQQDAEAIGKSSGCPDVRGVAPIFSSSAQVVYKSNNTNSSIMGTTPDYESIGNAHVQRGRFIAARDVDTSARVAVLGPKVAKTLFGTGDPMGNSIKLNRIPFDVVGIMESKGAGGMGGSNQDDMIYIPVTTAQSRLFGTLATTPTGQRRVSMIYVSAVGEQRVDAAMQEITNLLRDRHKIKFQDDDFSVVSQKQLLGMLSTITGILTVFLGSIAAISLLVGGIGIMNIMLVSVTERTHEIGIRKAVGARRRDVLAQFLLEAVTLSVTGGVMGVVVGIGIAQLVNLSGAMTTQITLDSVLLSVSFAMAVGLLFGLYPAWRASLLHPIDALRYE